MKSLLEILREGFSVIGYEEVPGKSKWHIICKNDVTKEERRYISSGGGIYIPVKFTTLDKVLK